MLSSVLQERQPNTKVFWSLTHSQMLGLRSVQVGKWRFGAPMMSSGSELESLDSVFPMVAVIVQSCPFPHQNPTASLRCQGQG